MVIASILLILFSLVLLALSVSTLWAATYAWWDPDARARTTYPELDGEDGLSFSLIMPCRHEQEDVMRATLERLLVAEPQRLRSAHLGRPATIPRRSRSPQRLADENPERVRVSVDHSPVKNKPRQLNTALRMCRNDVVGVFDAESIAAPNLLRNIDNSFRTTGADAVQGAVQLINYRDTLVLAAQLPRVLHLVQLAAAHPRQARLHPARRQHGLRPAARCWKTSAAGTRTASPRTASSVCACRRCGTASSSPTPPSS